MMNALNFRVLILSDVSLGRGTPQLSFLAQSLARAGATVRVIEPDFKGTSEVELPEVEMVRIVTLLPPAHPSFAIDYTRACRTQIDEYRPQVVFVTSGWMVPAIATAQHRPFRTIFYAFENKAFQIPVPPYSPARWCDFMAETADWILVPEPNRADLDYSRAVAAGKVVIVYNTCPIRDENRPLPQIVFDEQAYLGANSDVAKAVDAGAFTSGKSHYQHHGRRELRSLGTRQANDCRFIIAGELSRRSLLDALLDPTLVGIQADLFGPPDGQGSSELVEQVLRAHPGIRYCGMVSNDELRRISPNYSFRLVTWGADSINEFFACPNKLFESIADGVPVIGTPQAQIHEVVTAWQCGILAPDWTAAGVAEALQLARRLFETEVYEQFVLNTLEARKELNWEAEFQRKILPLVVGAPGTPASAMPLETARVHCEALT